MEVTPTAGAAAATLTNESSAPDECGWVHTMVGDSYEQGLLHVDSRQKKS